MLVHLGEGFSVPARHIIAVIDLEKAGEGETKVFLDKQRELGAVVAIGPEESRSAVLAGEAGDYRVYLSPIRSVTLLLRAASYGIQKTAI